MLCSEFVISDKIFNASLFFSVSSLDAFGLRPTLTTAFLYSRLSSRSPPMSFRGAAGEEKSLLVVTHRFLKRYKRSSVKKTSHRRLSHLSPTAGLGRIYRPYCGDATKGCIPGCVGISENGILSSGGGTSLSVTSVTSVTSSSSRASSRPRKTRNF